MNAKAWITGIAVAIAIASGWVASFVQGDVAPKSKWGLTCAPAWAVFDQKKRCGFVDLGQLVTLEGWAVRTKTHNDGDFSINVYPFKEYQHLLEYKGRRNKPYVHVEFMPCERTYSDVEPVLQEVKRRIDENILTYVRITGRWAYDGVDHNGEWREQLDECLSSRPPDPEIGWLEIHPAYSIEILDLVDVPNE